MPVNPLVERCAYQVHEEWIYDVTEMVRYEYDAEGIFIPGTVARSILKLVNTPFEGLHDKAYLRRIKSETDIFYEILCSPEYRVCIPEALAIAAVNEKAILRPVPVDKAHSLAEAISMFSHFRMKLWFVHMLKNYTENLDKASITREDYERWMRQAKSAYDNSLPTKYNQLILDSEKQSDRNQVCRILNAAKPFLEY